ncbi:hypothetical protein [Pilimelia columellifera]
MSADRATAIYNVLVQHADARPDDRPYFAHRQGLALGVAHHRRLVTKTSGGHLERLADADFRATYEPA